VAGAVTWASMTDTSAASPSGPAAVDAPEDDRSERRPRGRRDWRDGGRSTRRWGWEVLGWALLALGAGLIASATLVTVVPGEWGSVLGLVVSWIAFLAVIVVALMRSRPRGLLRFRPVDLLYGVALGGMLRLAQGTMAGAFGEPTVWPTYPSIGGALPPRWWFDEALGTVLIAPVLEEFLFRAVILVAVYTAVRRLAGRAFGAVAATLASIGLFVLAHAVLAPLSLGAAASLVLLALVASVLVLSTGRIWGAVLVHIVYNATWVALATVGTLLSA
jgi:uncharacterized protein